MRRREDTANDTNLPKVHHREGYLTNVQIKPVIFIMFCCASAELFFSYRDSVAAPRETAWTPRSSICDAQRAVPRDTVWAPRQSNGGAQRGTGLGTTIKYLRGAAGIGLGIMIKYLRRATKQRPGNHDQVTCDFQRVPPRTTAWALRSSTCAVPRASA
jgi:hypothetical protein